MIGAILGDMIGAPYEFDRGAKSKVFPLFIRSSQFTDDTVMTVAVAEALMDTLCGSDGEISTALISSMQKWGRRYPHAGYGCMFVRWLRTADPKPYGSFGNGSAMRVSAAGWLFDDLPTTRRIARLTAAVSHDHPGHQGCGSNGKCDIPCQKRQHQGADKGLHHQRIRL